MGRRLQSDSALNRAATFQIRSPRLSFLLSRMSRSRNRFPLSRDMLYIEANEMIWNVTC